MKFQKSALPESWTRCCLVAALLWPLEPYAALAAPLGTSFTYQGYLEDVVSAVNGTVDLSFELFDAAAGGSSLGSVIRCGTAIDRGRFTVEIDFGDVFDGTALWLEIGVVASGCGGFETLAPRQALNAAPFAQHTQDAERLGGELATSYLTTSGATAIDLAVSGELRVSEIADPVGGSFFETCAAGSSIRQIALDGSVVCEVNAGGDNLGDHVATQNLQLGTNYLSADGDDEGLSISGTGQVGINKAIPQSSLHVGGDIRLDKAGQIIFSDTGNVLREFNGNVRLEGTATTTSGIDLEAKSGIDIESDNGDILISAGDDLFLDARGDDILIDPDDVVRIDGKVSIGEPNAPSSPSFTLHVLGTAGKTGGGTWDATSDRRLKHNIRSIDGIDALRQLLELKGVQFDWVVPAAHNSAAGRYGFIAQDVASSFPEWVSKITVSDTESALVEEDGYALGFSLPHDFFALLIEALRVQEQRIGELEKELLPR